MYSAWKISSATCAHRLFPLLIVCLLQVFLMAETDERNERVQKLRTWFHLTEPDGPVDENGMQAWLDEFAEIHFMPSVKEDGRAKAVIENGFTSKHSIAALTSAELKDLGFMMGNAKRMAIYLGEPPRPPSPGRVLPAGPMSIAATTQQSAQLGTMIAMAVTTSQTEIQLNGGSGRIKGQQ